MNEEYLSVKLPDDYMEKARARLIAEFGDIGRHVNVYGLLQEQAKTYIESWLSQKEPLKQCIQDADVPAALNHLHRNLEYTDV